MAPVRIRARQGRIAAIAILALLAQLLLPIVHAQAYAQRQGVPLLYAFCGEHPSLLTPQLRAMVAAAALPASSDNGRGDDLSCSFCAPVHGGALAASSDFGLTIALPPLGLITAPRGTAAVVRLVALPPLRAPPASA